MVIRALAAGLIAVALAKANAAVAQISSNIVTTGILGDMSGPDADRQGPGDVVAVANFGDKVNGAPI